MVEIHEHYKAYVPPRWVRPTVERLLDSLSDQHLGGLAAVVLTDSASIGKGRTGRVGRRKRKYRRNQCLGFYHRAEHDAEAWIELVVDNILPEELPAALFWLRFFRDLFMGKTLYHEIGHHLEATVGAATRQGEAAADDWKRRLLRIHMRRRYWYLWPVGKLLELLMPWIRRRAREVRDTP